MVRQVWQAYLYDLGLAGMRFAFDHLRHLQLQIIAVERLLMSAYMLDMGNSKDVMKCR